MTKKCCKTCVNWQWDWYTDGEEFETCIDYDNYSMRHPDYPGDEYTEWDCRYWEEWDY